MVSAAESKEAVMASASYSYSCSYPAHSDPASIGPLYLLHFASVHHSFRLPEFTSAAKYLGLPFALVPTPASANYNVRSAESSTSTWTPDVSRPYMFAHLPSDEAATKLLARCVSLRSIWVYWSHGATYDELHARNKANASLWQQHVPRHKCPSWKAHISSYSGTISEQRKRAIIQQFAYMDFQGDIRLRDPAMRWGVIEEYLPQECWPPEMLHHEQRERDQLGDRDPRLVQIFCGRRVDISVPPLVGSDTTTRKSSDPALEGQMGLARDLIDRLNLKKRAYIGTTSMEAELSLLQANMALAGPGKVCYDPFAGTGSLLYACAVFGAMVFGSDIDGRAMRGPQNARGRSGKPGIMCSAEQYSIEGRVLDLAVFDMTQSPWRVGGVVDAIVADPPYGVREGARRLGKRDPAKQRTEPFWMPDGLGPGRGCWSHERSDYVPPTRPYHLRDLVDDLLDYAYHLLTPRGRLVFWLPDMIDDETGDHQLPVQLPRHTRRPRGTGRMRLVHHSLQDFGKWGRRLITMEKILPEHDDDDDHLDVPQTHSTHQVLQHGVFSATADPNEFRNRYFEPRASKTAPS